MFATPLPTIVSLAADLVEGRTGVVLRNEIVEPVVTAIVAKHRRWGWGTARIALWMGNLPGLAGHPAAQPWFIDYVTELLHRPAGVLTDEPAAA
jgi:hypothetical protein